MLDLLSRPQYIRQIQKKIGCNITNGHNLTKEQLKLFYFHLTELETENRELKKQLQTLVDRKA